MVNPRTDVTLFPGVSPGSELGWNGPVGAMVPQISALATGIFEFIVFKKKGWDYRTFDVARDLPVAEDIAGPALDAIDPNLQPFFDRGGKLLQYHGWGDPGIPPLNSIGYYESVRATVVQSISIGRVSTTAIGCSWCRAWTTALAAPVPIGSMR